MFSSTPTERIVHQTPHFHVQSRVSQETTAQIGQQLEQAIARCETTIGDCRQPPPPLTVHIYARRSAYDRQAAALQLPRRITAGFWTPQGEASLHILWKADLGVDPRITLLHEVTHHYLHHAWNYRIPLSSAAFFAKDEQILVSVPLWLNEGLATYFEGLGGGRLTHGARLKELKRLIRTDRLPDLASLLQRRTNQGMTSAEYAAAWGMVYFFLHCPHVKEAAQWRRRLDAYLKRCCDGFLPSGDEAFARYFVSRGEKVDEFKNKWRTHVARHSLQAFESLFLPRKETLQRWQQDWARVMVQVR